MMCDVYFSFCKIYNFIKEVVYLYKVFFKELRPLFLYLLTCSNIYHF